MMKYLFLSLLVLSTTVISAEKKTVAQASAKKSVVISDKTLDVTPESESEEVAEKTGLYTDDHSMKASVSCKTKVGREIKQGEKGYKECIKNVKRKNSDIKVEFEK